MSFNFHENHKLLFSTVIFGFAILTIIIAVGPAISVQENNVPLPNSKPMTKPELRGLNIYISEGCVYCHTQQVRPIPQDKIYGRPSAPGDYARLKPLDVWRMTPAILGSERTGPDLSNIGNRQPSEVWQFIHLYEPRSVVKASVMQAFPWLFEVKENPDSNDLVVPVPKEYVPKNGKVVATQDAKDLVAYLLSLKQAPIEEASLSKSKTTGKGLSSNGAQLFNSTCASCHQSNGEGIQEAFPPLKGDPVVTASDPTEHIKTVLFGAKGRVINGVSYSSEMPAWGSQLNDDEAAAILITKEQAGEIVHRLLLLKMLQKSEKKGNKNADKFYLFSLLSIF